MINIDTNNISNNELIKILLHENKISHINQKKICNICYDILKNDKYTTLCGHLFHKKCIKKSYKYLKKCPYCCNDIVLT